MKKFLLLIFLFLFPAISYAQPSIVFDSETHDFGTIENSDTLRHTFTITNAGNEDLVIEKVTSS
jgi:Protein of unknown function (DUF1573)